MLIKRGELALTTNMGNAYMEDRANDAARNAY